MIPRRKSIFFIRGKRKPYSGKELSETNGKRLAKNERRDILSSEQNLLTPLFFPYVERFEEKL
jgi:hypothetical protein